MEASIEEIIRNLNNVYDYCKPWGNHHVIFEFKFHEIGEPLTYFNMTSPGGHKSRVAHTSDELTQIMFDLSMNFYVVNVNVDIRVSWLTFGVALVESPDHSTNITPELVEAFNRIFELDKWGRG